MRKLLLNIVAVALTIFGMAGVAMLAPTSEVSAYTCPDGKPATKYSDCAAFSNVDASTKDADLNNILNTVINVIIGLVGFVAVAVIIIGGISFITSQGDTNKVTKARNTILYGVVGLVVALLAFAIVNFVLTNVFGS